jgi:hypothetical protein
MSDKVGVAQVATATHRRGWNIDTVVNEGRPEREKARAVRERQRAIGRELRRFYDGVAKEPVPDDFLELLHQIDESGAPKGKSGT